MTVFRRGALIGLLLVLGGGQLFAASREERAYAAAVAAFQDKIWDRAETQLAQFVSNYRHSTNAPLAVLLLAQAEFKQGRFAEAGARLAANLPAAGNLADQYVRWQGEAQFAQGDYSAASETFAGLVGKFPESPLCLGAVVAAAAAREKLGEWSRLDELLVATNGVFARTVRLDPDNELVASGRLLLAQSKFSRKDFTGAAAVLSLLNPQTLAPAQDYQRLHLLCRVKLAVNDLDAALAAATDLRQVAHRQKNAAWQAEGVSLTGRALGEKKLFPEAIAVWTENLTNAVPVEKQQEAVLKIAALAAAQTNLTAATAALDRFVAQFPRSPAAGLALLTAGELCLKSFVAQPAATNLLAAAQSRFEASTNSPLAGRAFLGLGWCFWLVTNYPASLANFQAAAGQLPRSEDRAVAEFKAGDAMFALTNYAGATNSYLAVLDGYGDFPEVAKSLGDRALYQVLRADIELRDTNNAAAAMDKLLEKFPASGLLDNSLLLAGEALSDFGKPANAREVFRRFETQFSGSPLKPEVEFAAARTFEQEQNWRAAVTGYGQWLKSYPTNDMQPKVKFALAQANFHAGDEAGAFRLFTAFVAGFPTNELAPLAQWWVADYYFRATNFTGVENYFAAETNYENIFQNSAWKASPLVWPARLMAGRAAMGRQGFSDAGRYFTKLIDDTNCPPEQADLKVQARFAYADALRQMAPSETNNASLQLALNLFGQICQLYPTNETGALAWSEAGDCNLQMGDLDAATNAYAQVLNSPAAGPRLRGRAQVGLGLVLEKKAALLPPEGRTAMLKQALEIYLNLLYTDEVADAFWQKKAGLQALPLLATVGDRNPEALDKFFDRLEKWLPQLQKVLEQKKAALGALKN